MQTLQTKTPKLTKKYLMQIMRKQLENRTFNREQFKKQYGLDTPAGDRNVRRYLNQIADEFGKIKTEDLIFLKKYCIDNLTEKALNRELDESTEAKIALAGEASRVELKEEITETKTVNINVKSMLAEYDSLFTPNRTETTNLPSNNPTKPIH